MYTNKADIFTSFYNLSFLFKRRENSNFTVFQCVRLLEPLPHRLATSANGKALIQEFIKDLHDVMPTFCRHHKLEFSIPLVSTPKFFNALKGLFIIFSKIF